MNTSLKLFYNSESQSVRIMSELWALENMFCPCCGNTHIAKMKNNAAVADFYCEKCCEIFELKAKRGNIGNKINDGAYDTMINRITSQTNPDLLIAQYSKQYSITDLILVPKFFFTPQIIEKRKPLSSKAKRSGWTGCNILYRDIPEQGKINIIQNNCIISVEEVVAKYSKIQKMKTETLELRGWLLDVLNCINDIKSNEFTLNDLYTYVEILQKKHMYNNHVKAKIRQQLQFLRDRGIIEFRGKGHYRKLV